jgi:predicted HTH domain antitoxin
MSIVINDDVLNAAALSADELLLEIAILLYQQQRLTLAQASDLARLDRVRFQLELASRQIDLHYDEDDLQTDLATLHKHHLI